MIVHYTEQLPTDPAASVLAKVDGTIRISTAYHHSATHLLHAALRNVLGMHVAQKGSMVNASNLRFDFSHFAKMTTEELAKVEAIVNEKIRENIPVVIKSMPKDEAMKLGAMALFGEKYGDTVRVVIIDPSYSIELCGGTHVGSTGELGLFKITSEAAVAAGVRRLEACCGKQAEDFVNAELSVVQQVREALKNPKDILRAIEQLQTDNTELKKQFEALETKQLQALAQQLTAQVQTVNGSAFIGATIQVSNADALKKICTELKLIQPEQVAILCANIGGKAAVAVSIADSICKAKGLDAGKIIKEIVAPLIKGGGGGQKTLATAGGQEINHFDQVIAAVKALL